MYAKDGTMEGQQTPDARLVREVLVDALAIESKGLLKPQPTVPPSLTASGQYGITKAIVQVHDGDKVTVNLFAVPAVVALRVAALLAEVL